MGVFDAARKPTLGHPQDGAVDRLKRKIAAAA